MEGFIIIFVLFAAFAIVAGVVSHRKTQERIASLSAWAKSRGLDYEPGKAYGFDDEHPELSCLQHGDNRYAFNIVSGRRDDKFMIAFDYHYETQSRDSDGNRQTTHHYFSAVLVQPQHALRPLLVRREGFFDKVKAGFGYNDIDFESAEFSRKFFVTAPDKRWAYDILHTRAIELIMDQPHDYTIELDHEVICIAGDDELDAFGLEQAFLYGNEILDSIPDYVRQDL